MLHSVLLMQMSNVCKFPVEGKTAYDALTTHVKTLTGYYSSVFTDHGPTFRNILKSIVGRS